MRSSHSDNPLLARHKRDTSSTCDPTQRHSIAVTPNDSDRLYSCAPADSLGDWSRTLYHDPFSLPATSQSVFEDCAAAAGTWLSAEPTDLQWDRGCSVSVMSSDGLLARSLRPPRRLPITTQHHHHQQQQQQQSTTQDQVSLATHSHFSTLSRYVNVLEAVRIESVIDVIGV